MKLSHVKDLSDAALHSDDRDVNTALALEAISEDTDMSAESYEIRRLSQRSNSCGERPATMTEIIHDHMEEDVRKDMQKTMQDLQRFKFPEEQVSRLAYGEAIHFNRAQ